MNCEIWKDIKGYEGLYKVSDKGRIKSFKKADKIIMRLTGRHYLGVTLYSADKVGTRRDVHRLVAETFLSDRLEGSQVNHIDGDKYNNELSNLEWVTAKENIQHAIEKGNFTTGEKNGLSKFTNEQVRHIRKSYKPYDPKYGGAAMARKYQVSNKTMHLILKGETYVDV